MAKLNSRDVMLIGLKGEPGKSAYEVAVDNGFKGTEEEWLNSLGGDGGARALIEKFVLTGLAPTITFSVNTTEPISVDLSTLQNVTAIDWGDGVVNTELTHEYAAYAGKRAIRIYGCTRIESDAFAGFPHNMHNLTISDEVEYIGQNAFANTKLMYKVEIGKPLRPGRERTQHMVIDTSAFENCTTINWLYLYECVKEINDYAFYGCVTLMDVYFAGDMVPSYECYGYQIFHNCHSLFKIIAQPKCVSDLKGYLPDYADKIVRSDFIQYKVPLTDDEKQTAREFIGAANKDVRSILYCDIPITSNVINSTRDFFNQTPKVGDLVISRNGRLFEVISIAVNESGITVYTWSFLTSLKGADGASIPSIADHSTEATPYLDINFGKANETRKAFFEHSFLMGETHFGDGFMQNKDGKRINMPVLEKDETMATESGVAEVNTNFGYYGRTGADQYEIKCGGLYIVFANDYDLKLCKSDGTVICSGAQQIMFMTAPYNGDKEESSVFVAMGMYIYKGGITNLVPVEGIQAELDDGSYITAGSADTVIFVSEMVKGKQVV